MNTRESEIESAKRLAAGSWGIEMNKFPLRFAKPAFFGEAPSIHKTTKINSGTVSLLNLGNGPIAITCSHVISEYRNRLQESDKIIFQIGECLIDPVSQLISESEELDLAVIELTERQSEQVTKDDEIGSCFFHPVSWPPKKVEKNQYVSFGGFPGKLRERQGVDELSFGSYSSGASRITVANDDYFVSQFEREYWVEAFSNDSIDLNELGGMSGGPAFVQRGLYFDFVGVIYEFSSSFELLYFRHSGVIDRHGEIQV